MDKPEIRVPEQLIRNAVDNIDDISPAVLKKRKRAVIYCRVSTEKQEQDGASLEFQEEKGQQWAALHGIDVLLVLKEVKSGYIHYALREKLTLARQMVRDGMADMIIVWDLRRFSRNFVHSAMIFEEIESVGAEIVSVSENIDNSLTGKLIRSILAWSAESEREKILEYANRHWQSRLEMNLPIGTGNAPYGWKWKDEEKTAYAIHEEEALVRVSLFTMFLEEDMSIRAIAHKLTEDGILTPGATRGARGSKADSTIWNATTIHSLLVDPANIGILEIAKTTTVVGPNGKRTRKKNEKMKVIPGGIPQLIPVARYEWAQQKLKNNQKAKSHPYRNPEDYLLKGHIYCKACNNRMRGYYNQSHKKVLPFYRCTKDRNRYNACPEKPSVRTDKIDQIVWEDCCRVFELLEDMRDTLDYELRQFLQNLLENTTGRQLIDQLKEEIRLAKLERDKHPEGSYYYNLVVRDVNDKEAQLHKHEMQYQESFHIMKASSTYQDSVTGFLDFLDTMKGRYHEASFKDKRNALMVLGVNVYIYPADKHETSECECIETDQEWFTVRETAEITNINRHTMSHHIRQGNITVHRRGVPATVVCRDALVHFLEIYQPGRSCEVPEKEWFALTTIRRVTKIGFYAMRRAITSGELQTKTIEIPHLFIHRDEINRFLMESPVRPKSERGNVAPRIKITYSPILAGVQSSCEV